MTDIENMRIMLTRAGVVFVESRADQDDDPVTSSIRTVNDIVITVNIEDQDDDHRHGYANFLAEFLFHQDGSLKTIGAWE